MEMISIRLAPAFSLHVHVHDPHVASHSQATVSLLTPPRISPPLMPICDLVFTIYNVILRYYTFDGQLLSNEMKCSSSGLVIVGVSSDRSHPL